METRSIDVKSITEYLKYKRKYKVVVVDFSASWCGPCKKFAPTYEKLALEFPKVAFLKVDIDKLGEDLEDAKNVSVVPSFKIFVCGKEKQFFTGANEAKLRTLIKKEYSEQVKRDLLE